MIDWVPGDDLGLDLPAHAEALRRGGAEWLTRAFRASGALGQSGSVRRITQCEELVVGGTGAKLLLSVEYAGMAGDLPTDLFVKFSRNFEDRIRDANRHHMLPEIRFASLSRDPAFPIAVPLCLFADQEAATATGILITERIAYGQRAIEPHRPKCMDHLLDDSLAHYRVIVSALGRLAGSHKAGKLGPAADERFPLDIDSLVAGNPNPYGPQRLTARVESLAEFVSGYPQLFPEGVADPGFLAGFAEEAPRFLARDDEIKAHLHADMDYIALCHWNANIDNAWFWREPDGSLHCGLIDWGSVGQIHLAMALWGSLSGAEPEIWNDHLDDLLRRFIEEYAASGGPRLGLGLLRDHLELYVMMMGLSSLMEAPRRIRMEIPEPSVLSGPRDPLLERHDLARVQLKITANMLNFWRKSDLGRHLREGRR